MQRIVTVACALALLVTPEVAESVELSWVIFPIRAEHPPPLDPTLLRTSKRVASVFTTVVEGSTRLESRAVRDEHCRDDGWRCPDEIASLLGVDRVVSLQLAEDHSQLALYVFSGRRGVVAQLTLPCVWNEGRPVCDLRRLSHSGAELAPRRLGTKEVFEAFAALEPVLRRCLGAGGAEPGVRVQLTVASSGRAHTVRLTPRQLQRLPRYTCVAEALEALEVAPFAGADAGTFVFELPGPVMTGEHRGIHGSDK